MTITTLFAWLGATLAITAFFMKTMIPLRVVSLFGHACFLVYGLLTGAYYVLLAYAVTFPFNIWRLHEMPRLVSTVKQAANSDLSVKWLQPFMKEQRFGDGHRVFIKGNAADHLSFITKGRVRLAEIGFFSPDCKRSLTAICAGDCVLHTTSASAFSQLYYRNPEFGYYVVCLNARRLTAEIECLRDANRQPPTDMAT
jgi:CRP/FNR family transcriptional regulator, cyclic AMP receptor protein